MAIRHGKRTCERIDATTGMVCGHLVSGGGNVHALGACPAKAKPGSNGSLKKRARIMSRQNAKKLRKSDEKRRATIKQKAAAKKATTEQPAA